MIRASDLVIWLIDPFPKKTSRSKITNIVEISIVKGNSFFTVSSFMEIGRITEATPKIKSIFKILLPITFPSTISELFDAKAFIETANSGADVPKAIIVRPINILDTLKFWAVDDAPSTKISAPLIKKTNPKINNNIFKNKVITLLFLIYHNKIWKIEINFKIFQKSVYYIIIILIRWLDVTNTITFYHGGVEANFNLEQGYDVVAGSMLGKMEYVLLNKDKIIEVEF